jgi:hypothetical protein
MMAILRKGAGADMFVFHSRRLGAVVQRSIGAPLPEAGVHGKGSISAGAVDQIVRI